MQRRLTDNLRAADVCATVSPHLASVLEGTPGADASVVVIPNGCDLPARGDDGTPRRRNAGLIGQLNERLDMQLLEAVQDAGIPDHRDRSPHRARRGTGRRLDAFLAAPNVTWLGELPSRELAPHLAEIGVGLTPYADTAFNRSSFPLKTLEYLASGVPVVASDLPAVRWLHTELVAIGSGPVEFANQVQRILDSPDEAGLGPKRRDVAALHTWHVRAAQILGTIQRSQAMSQPRTFRPPAGDRSSADVDHVLLTRFNLPSAGAESIVRAKDGWLRARIELFRRFCLPSVLRQTRQDFKWIIYLDPQSPDWLVSVMDDLTAAGPSRPSTGPRSAAANFSRTCAQFPERITGSS